MAIISLKLNEALDQQLAEAAQQLGETKSWVVREALASYFAAGPPPEKEASFLDLAGEILGTGEGPADLSANKRHLRGYGA